MTRYARQMILSQVGPSGQEALTAARVVVVGAGGLAAPVLPLLAGAGVGHITLVDGDDVALSNLHRQTLFTESDIGTPKVTAAARALAARNSACTVVAHPVTLGPDTVAKLCHNATLVLDCADSFAASYVLSDHCLHAGLPLISASALGFAGYVGGFCGGLPRSAGPRNELRHGGGHGAGRRHDRCCTGADGAGLPPRAFTVPSGAVGQL